MAANVCGRVPRRADVAFAIEDRHVRHGDGTPTAGLTAPGREEASGREAPLKLSHFSVTDG